MREIGRCIGETSLNEVIFISKEMPKVGEYVSLEYDGKNVLGMIESLLRGNIAINDEIYDPKIIEKIKEIEGEEYYIRGSIRILGDIDNNFRIPRTPAPPGTKIKTANTEKLSEILKVDPGLKLGNLITQEDVEIEVDIDKMVTRHLAILAMTGAGKSNTVAVITDGLLEKNGCVLIFDMHSEYVNTKFPHGDKNEIEAKVNPQYLSLSELKILANIKGSAYIEEQYLWKAHEKVKERMQNGELNEKFLDAIINELESLENTVEQTKHKGSILSAKMKIKQLKERYRDLLEHNVKKIIKRIEPNKANIIDLGSLDESASDVIVSHVLQDILNSRKGFIKEDNGLEFPIFIIIEEAHILAPKGGRSTDSKYWISRVAREGRKFGVGICLVSQSPKSLDSDSLSQANNMIILRLVEPQDQNHVQSASESLSNDLLKQLPSLNIGEAVVVGLMTKIPTLVKIKEFPNELGGNDIKVVNEWENHLKKIEEDKERQKKEDDNYSVSDRLNKKFQDSDDEDDDLVKAVE